MRTMSVAFRRSFICHICRGAAESLIKKHKRRNGAIQAYSTASTQRRPLRLAIIGSGPAGYYTAYRIMKKLPESFIDMYESLPTPYGLVRFGVAPDHPEVKKSSETLDDVGKWPNFNFIGNVPIGGRSGALPLSTIATHYDGIVFAYGASKDKTLGIPGEESKGVHSARAFVGWYNGLPEYSNLDPDLQGGETAVVFGQGNVALDVARILLAPIDQLRSTDISEQALEVLSRSRVKDVQVIGRRGPLQAPYTIKELRELVKLQGVGFRAPPEGWDRHIGLPRKKLPRQLRRIMELVEKPSASSSHNASKHWQLRYLLNPAECLSQQDETSDGGQRRLRGIKFEQMEYSQRVDAILEAVNQQNLSDEEKGPALLNAIRSIRVKSTGSTDTVEASLAFRSIGYLSEALEGFKEFEIPFDEKLGIIPNDVHGRVLSPDQGPGDLTAGHIPGMYCAGWVKKGPTGVIASTLDDAFHTADIIVSDWESGVKFNDLPSDSDKVGWEGVQSEVKRRGIRRVSWQDWEKIDAEEKRRGLATGKPREKITSISEMLKILDS